MSWGVFCAMPEHLLRSPFFVLFFGVLLPRLCVIGCFPFMDEGYYAYQAMTIAQSVIESGSLPYYGQCNLYALLLAPLTALPVNPLVSLRFCDLLFALVAGWLLFCIVARLLPEKTLASCVTLLVLLGLNAFDCVQAGAKNSFFAAFIPLFTAYLLSLRGTVRAFFCSGLLMAIAVLLRETFAVYAILSCLAVFLAAGLGKALFFCAGGICGGLSLVGLLAYFRGGLWQIVSSYLSAGAIFAAESERVLSNALHQAQRFCLEFWPAVFLLFCACFFLFRRPTKTVLFFLALLLAPVAEIAGKISYLYHFSLLFLGFAGLLALGCARVIEIHPHAGKRLACALFLACCITFANTVNLGAFPGSMRVLLTSRFDWPASVRGDSNTLLAADAIRDAGGKSLSVSGFMHFLYPASGLLPREQGMDDLSRLYLLLGRKGGKLGEALLAAPPDVIAVGKTEERDHVAMFTGEIERAVLETGLYERYAEIPVDTKKNYGWIGCTLFRRLP